MTNVPVYLGITEASSLNLATCTQMSSHLLFKLQLHPWRRDSVHLSVVLFRAEQPSRAGSGQTICVFFRVCLSLCSRLTDPRSPSLSHITPAREITELYRELGNEGERVRWATKKAITLSEWTLITVE